MDARIRGDPFQLTSYISFPSTKSPAPAGSSGCPQSGTLKLNRTRPSPALSPKMKGAVPARAKCPRAIEQTRDAF